VKSLLSQGKNCDQSLNALQMFPIISSILIQFQIEDEQEKKPTLAIFEFQWNLTNIPQKTGTILSKMIAFR